MIPISSKRPSINLPLFINTLSESFSSSDHHAHPTSKSPNSSKSPRIFEGGVVGLGIVAAMNDAHEWFSSSANTNTSRVAKMAISSKSEPIPIVFAKPITNFRDPMLEKDEMEELSESYTCVISHLGYGNSVKKREYFNVPEVKNGNFGGISKSGVFFTSPPKNTEATTLFQTTDFLSFCYLCKKKLHGLDIFMYRGEKAFCSTECRCQQISSDERRAKCGSGALKSFAYSVSPCSSPMIFSAGVAAA